MNVYVKYGSTAFDPAIFKPIENEVCFSKPRGGMWSSRIDAKNGWRQWCIDEDFRYYDDNDCFRFKLKDNASVLYLTNANQLSDLPHIESSNRYLRGTHYLDFEKLQKLGFDAIEVTMTNGLYMALYGWDVDSILIMNPDIVVPIKEAILV